MRPSCFGDTCSSFDIFTLQRLCEVVATSEAVATFLAGSQEVVSSEEHEKFHSVPGTTSPSWRQVSQPLLNHTESLKTQNSVMQRCNAMQDCAELTHGFFALREICETGPPLSTVSQNMYVHYTIHVTKADTKVGNERK